MSASLCRRGAASALALAALALALAPAAAQARTTRAYEGSFGSGSLGTGVARTPANLAVDQSNGDVYVYGPANEVSRFDSTGAPKNFTAGPDAGTNVLSTDLPFIGFGGDAYIAIDNSGGPLDGTVYVASGQHSSSSNTQAVRAFARSGAKLGEITGSTTSGEEWGNLCGIAVDRSDGSLYVSQPGTPIPGTLGATGPGTTWRYVPDSPFGSLDDADYALSGATTGHRCAAAADSGHLYATNKPGTEVTGRLERFEAAEFNANGSAQPIPETIDESTSAVAVDPQNGDLYANHGSGVQVYDSSGARLYRFGARAYFGAASQGIAVKSAASGPAEKAYVADPSSEHEIDVFGALTKAPTYTRPELASFGPDGTSATQFDSGSPFRLAFAGAAQRLYALDRNAPGIYGFDAAAPPAFPLLAGFDPLGTAAFSSSNASAPPPALAVDNTALASQGNLYLVSDQTDLLYGFDDTGAPLGGAFPLDPTATPGAPNGDPAEICGVAVDSSGNLWVANSATEQVLRYSSAGAYLGAVDTSAQGAPCSLAFDSADNLYADIASFVPRDGGVSKYTAASGYASATHIVGSYRNGQYHSLAVDPSTDHLYVADQWYDMVDEFDPAGDLVDEFTLSAKNSRPAGIALDSTSGNLYLANSPVGRGEIHAFGPGVLLPELKAKAAGDLANDSATLNGEVNDQGLALSDCHFEYVSEAAYRVSGFTDLASGGSVPCDPPAGSIPLDLDEHPVTAPATGLDTNTVYRFRLLATNANGSVSTEALSLASAGPPQVETTGSPIRSATKALLQARVYPVREPTTYHFEYGTQGPCDANPCASSPDLPAGSGDLIRPAAQWVAGLSPNTTYHYRVIADNGNPAGPQAGEDMTLTTRASDDPLSHGDYPGPPGSDRAWELVSLPDSNGNPAGFNGYVFSADGNRAYYSILGGTSFSDFGALLSLYFAQRPAGQHPTSGWQSQVNTASREESTGVYWGDGIEATDDLSTAVTMNSKDDKSLWRIAPSASPTKLYEPVSPERIGGFVGPSGTTFAVSEENNRALTIIYGGTPDPAHPSAGASLNLYDISSGATPELLSLLPGETVAACGVEGGGGVFPTNFLPHSNWLSESGDQVLFPSSGDNCSNPSQIYLRDIAAGQTTRVSPPQLSGPACAAGLIKRVGDDVYFATGARLLAADTEPDRCNTSSDIYRRNLDNLDLECLTCLVAGLEANASSEQAMVADDGSRLYFRSGARLLREAPAGSESTYRLDLGSGDLAYVGPSFSLLQADIVPDGSILFFSSSSPVLDPLGGALRNGGRSQVYRYDDVDGSLTCVSCPQDGSAPAESALGVQVEQQSENGVLADNGVFVFSTPVALVSADQNASAGGDPQDSIDVYEWRDGRVLLVTDGLSRWPRQSAPNVRGINRSGRDVYFLAAAQYTPDAIDNYLRLYDARIGGGIDFPKAPPPCPLEVCQGTPQGAPQDPEPASLEFRGAGNPAPEPANCAAPARRAARLARQARRYALRAKRMRAIAKRSANPRRTRTARRRAQRLAKAAGRRAGAAKKLRGRAKRCRAANARRASR